MDMLIGILPIILLFVFMYFVVMLPEKKRKKKYDEMISQLQVNDDIMTRGGIIGRIVSLDEENFVLETGSDRTRIKFTKTAISNKIYKD